MSGSSAPHNGETARQRRTDYAWLHSQRQAFGPHSGK